MSQKSVEEINAELMEWHKKSLDDAGISTEPEPVIDARSAFLLRQGAQVSEAVTQAKILEKAGETLATAIDPERTEEELSSVFQDSRFPGTGYQPAPRLKIDPLAFASDAPLMPDGTFAGDAKAALSHGLRAVSRQKFGAPKQEDIEKLIELEEMNYQGAFHPGLLALTQLVHDPVAVDPESGRVVESTTRLAFRNIAGLGSAFVQNIADFLTYTTIINPETGMDERLYDDDFGIFKRRIDPNIPQAVVDTGDSIVNMAEAWRKMQGVSDITFEMPILKDNLNETALLGLSLVGDFFTPFSGHAKILKAGGKAGYKLVNEAAQDSLRFLGHGEAADKVAAFEDPISGIVDLAAYKNVNNALGLGEDASDFARGDISLAQRATQQISDRFVNIEARGATLDKLKENKATEYLANKLENAELTLLDAGKAVDAGQPLRENVYGLVSSLARFASQNRSEAADALIDAVKSGALGLPEAQQEISKAAADYFKSINVMQNRQFQRFFYTDVLRPSVAREIAELTGGNYWRFANQSTLIKASEYDRVMPKVEEEVASILDNYTIVDGQYFLKNPKAAADVLIDEVGAVRVAKSKILTRITKKLVNNDAIDAQELLILREKAIDYSIRTNPQVRAAGMKAETLSQDVFKAASLPPERRMRFLPGTQGFEQFTKAIQPAIRYFSSGASPAAAEALPVAMDVNVKFTRWLEDYQSSIADIESLYRKQLSKVDADDPAEAVRLIVQTGLSRDDNEFVRLMETVYSGAFTKTLKEPTMRAVEELGLQSLVQRGDFQLSDIQSLADKMLDYVSDSERRLLEKARANLRSQLANISDKLTGGLSSKVSKVLRRKPFDNENSRLSYTANAYAMSRIQSDLQARALEELMDMSFDLTFETGAVTGEKMFRNIVQTLFDNPGMVSRMNSTERFAGEIVQTLLEGTNKSLAERTARAKMSALNQKLSADLRLFREYNKKWADELKDKRNTARLLKYAEKQMAHAEEAAAKASITKNELKIVADLLEEKTKGVADAEARASEQLDRVKEMLAQQVADIEKTLKEAKDPAVARLDEIDVEIPSIKLKERVDADQQADLEAINERYDRIVESLTAAKIKTGTRRQKAELETKEDFADTFGKKIKKRVTGVKDRGLFEMNKVHTNYMDLRTANNKLLEDQIETATTTYRNSKELRAQHISEKFEAVEGMDDPASLKKLLEDVENMLDQQHDEGLQYLATVDELRRATRNHNQACYRTMVAAQLKVKNATLASMEQVLSAKASQAKKVFQDAIYKLGQTGEQARNALKSEKNGIITLLAQAQKTASRNKKDAQKLAKQFRKAIDDESKQAKKAIKDTEKTRRLSTRARATASRRAAEAERSRKLQEADAKYKETLLPLQEKLKQARAEYQAMAATRLKTPPTITQAEMDAFANEYLDKALGRDFRAVVAYLSKNGIIPRTDTVRSDMMPAIENLMQTVEEGRSSLMAFGNPEQQEQIEKFMNTDYLRDLQNDFSRYKFKDDRDISGYLSNMWRGLIDATTLLRRIRIGGLLGGPTVFTPNVDFFGLNAIGAPLIAAVAAPGYVNTVIRAQAAAFVSILPQGTSLNNMRKVFEQPLSQSFMDLSRAVPGARLSTRATRTIAGAAAGGLVGGLPGAMFGGAAGALSANWAKSGAKIGKMQLSPEELNRLADREDFASFYSLEWETGFMRDAAQYTGLNKYLKPMGGAERLVKNFFAGMSGSKNYWAYATQTYDEAFRKAVFIEALTQGRPMHEARILARNVLLDYAAMPKVIRKYFFKQAVFSSFFYGMASEVLKSPFMGKGDGFKNIARMIRLKESSRDPMSEELLYPSYVDARIGTFFLENFGGKALVLTGPSAPPLEIIGLMGRVHDMAITGDSIGLMQEGSIRFLGFGAQYAVQSYTDALMYGDDLVQAGYMPANYILALQALDQATGRPVGAQFLKLFGCEPVNLSVQLQRAEEPTYAGSSWKFPNNASRTAFIAMAEAFSLSGLERGTLNVTNTAARMFGDPAELAKQGKVDPALNAIRLMSVVEAEYPDQVNYRANQQVYKEILNIRRKGQLPE